MPLVDQGEICLVKDVALAVKSVLSYTPCPPTKAPPSSFWEVILDWGNTWMWDNLSTMGDLDWISSSIADNSCVAVTDGSYMKEMYPHFNSVAFVFECSKGRGRLWSSFGEYMSVPKLE
jgi:hypothetical protein